MTLWRPSRPRRTGTMRPMLTARQIQLVPGRTSWEHRRVGIRRPWLNRRRADHGRQPRSRLPQAGSSQFPGPEAKASSAHLPRSPSQAKPASWLEKRKIRVDSRGFKISQFGRLQATILVCLSRRQEFHGIHRFPIFANFKVQLDAVRITTSDFRNFLANLDCLIFFHQQHAVVCIGC